MSEQNEPKVHQKKLPAGFLTVVENVYWQPINGEPTVIAETRSTRECWADEQPYQREIKIPGSNETKQSNSDLIPLDFGWAAANGRTPAIVVIENVFQTAQVVRDPKNVPSILTVFAGTTWFTDIRPGESVRFCPVSCVVYSVHSPRAAKVKISAFPGDLSTEQP